MESFIQKLEDIPKYINQTHSYEINFQGYAI
jgi:hypothetical protein